MKTNIYLLFTIILFASCNSTKSSQKEIPFTIQNATYQNWFGGQEGIKGVKIEIVIKTTSEKISFQTLYYQDKKTTIKSINNTNFITLIADINTSKEDKIISKSKEEEYGNQAPIKPKYPNLTESETIIEFLQNGTKKHYKVSLSEKEALYYP